MKTNPQRIEAERALLGLTQEDLADRADVSRATVQDAERAEPRHPKTVDTIRKLAAVLRVQLADIAVAENDAEAKALERDRERANV